MNPDYRQHLIEGEKLGLRYALVLPETAPSGRAGGQLGKRIGSSIDFQDYREYQPGDDLRHIDWSVYARTDRLSVKLYREEVSPHLDLVLDGSKSMDLETSGKGAAMAKLAAVLTTAAANAHCTQHVWLAGEGFRRLRHDRHPAGTWDDLDLDCARSLDESWALLPPRLRNLGVRVLVSDLFWMANPVQTIRRLAEGAASLFVVQLLAQADAKPPVHGNLRLVDSETGQLTEIYIDSMVEKRYRDSLARLQQSWHDACRQSGAKFLTLIAEEIEDNLSTLQQAELLTAT